MSTTELLVEYLVLGSLADIWLLIIALYVVPGNYINWMQSTNLIEKLSPVIAVMFLSVTYTIGGLVNFLAQSIFDRIQKKHREEIFRQRLNQPYSRVRGFVYHNASSDVMARFRSDGHIIRVSRGNILNFSLIALSLLLHLDKYPIQVGTGIGLSIVFAVLSCFQWVRRYKSNYREMADEYLAIKEEHSRVTVNRKR